MNDWTVEDLTPHIGSEVSGAGLENIDDAGFEALNKLLMDRKVLFFRDVTLSHRGLDTLARHFGEPEPAPHAASVPAYPCIAIVESTPKRTQLSNYWHSDGSYFAKPPAVTVLRAVDIPPVGGDTLWADMEAAYRGLDDDMQRRIEGLSAVHAFSHYVGLFASRPGYFTEAQIREAAAMESVVQPLVRVHPETGRRSIFVNWHVTSHIVGLDANNSRALLDKLFEPAKLPEYQVRLRWKPNTVAIWDNRSTQHYAAHDYGNAYRRMERITVGGEEVIPAN